MGKKIKDFIKNPYLINLILLILFYIICKYRLHLGASYSIIFDDLENHRFDSYFFVNGAYNFENFNSLIDFALIKNRAYMWFLLFAHNSGIDLRDFISFYWIVAAFLVFISLYKVSRNKILASSGFLYVVLHPIAFFKSFQVSIYRNLIFVPTIFTVLSLYLLFYHYLFSNKNVKASITGFLLGIAFCFIYFLTETGIVFLLIHIALLFIFFVFKIIDCFKNYKIYIPTRFVNIKYLIKKIIILLLVIIFPIAIGFIGITIYKFSNYRVFGVYEINMRTEGEVGRFISNVQDIESEKTDTVVWCSLDQIDKAYTASKTFQDYYLLHKHMKQDAMGIDFNDYPYGVHGDFLGWIVQNALFVYKISYPNATRIFKYINEELEAAFKDGTLKRTNKIKITKTIGRFTKEEIKTHIIPLFKNNFLSMVGLKELDSYIDETYGKSKDNSTEYFKFFNIKSDRKIVNCANEVKSIIRKFQFINTLLHCFVIVNTILSFFIMITKLILKQTKVKNSIADEINKIEINPRYWLLSVMFYMFYTLYILSMSFFQIWLYDYSGASNSSAHLYYYAPMSVGFFAFAIIFSILSCNDNFIVIFNRIKTYLSTDAIN